MEKKRAIGKITTFLQRFGYLRTNLKNQESKTQVFHTSSEGFVANIDLLTSNKVSIDRSWHDLLFGTSLTFPGSIFAEQRRVIGKIATFLRRFRYLSKNLENQESKTHVFHTVFDFLVANIDLSTSNKVPIDRSWRDLLFGTSLKFPGSIFVEKKRAVGKIRTFLQRFEYLGKNWENQ